MTNVDLPYLLGFRDYLWSSIFGGAAGGRLLRASARSAMYCRHRAPARDRSSWRAGACRASSPPSFLFLNMLAVVIKMFMRHALNIKYVWVTPWLNI